MKPNTRQNAALLAACIAAAALQPSQAASIQSLGDFPNGFWSRAFAVSSDGSVVAGTSYWFDGSRHAFRWTAATGLVDLGAIGSATDNAATALSADGSVAAGFSGTEGFRWTSAGFLNLGHLAGQSLATPLGTSQDGNIIVGFDGNLPFRWTSTGGITALPTLAGATTGEAGAITPTGSFIAGNLGLNLVRWQGTTPSIVAPFTSDIDVQGSAISREGNVIGGRVLHPGGNNADAVRWVEGVGASFLPDLVGGDANAAILGLTADGLTQVGYGSDSPFWTTATVWSSTSGLQRLADILVAQGVNLAYWASLDEAYAISPDGRFIVGSGTVAATFLQEAFIAEITPLATPAQTPFGGVARTLPGRVQSEDYDLGGQLVAHFDTTAGNSGGLYRTDAVDLVSNTETTGGVSWQGASREWTEYTVNVTTAGSYVLRFRVAASATGGIIKAHYGLSGQPLSEIVGSLSVPSTGSLNTYRIIEADVTLPAGTGVLRVCANTGTFNVNWVEVAPRGVAREIWNGITGTTTASIPVNNPPSSRDVLTTPETPQNTGDNYGIRLRGYLRAPTTGNYRFWIASDANSDLFLSTTTEAANRVRIASVNGTTAWRQWNRFNTQRSAAISLVAGQLYYFEVLQKESTGADHVSVGWSRPGQSSSSPAEIIPTSVLSAIQQ